MKLKTSLCLILAISITLSAAIVKPENPSENKAVSYRWPVVNIPQMSKAPVIDGRVEKTEWLSAVQLAPLVTLEKGLSTRENNFLFVGYDEKNLYLAFQFYRPFHALIPSSGTDPMGVWRDDCLEFFLRPEFGARWEYNFVGNAAGIFEEGRRQIVTDKNWKCEWQYKARKTNWGWEGELAIPFSSLGQATPKPGDIWEMAIVNNQKTPWQDLASWSFLKNWNACEDFGYLVFGGEVPAVRILQMGEISRDEVGTILELVNFTSAPAELQIQLALYDSKKPEQEYFKEIESAANPLGPQAEVKEWLPANKVADEVLQNYRLIKKIEEKVIVPANQSRRISLLHYSTRGLYLMHYQIVSLKDNKLLAGGVLPFLRTAPLEVSLTPYILSAGVVEVTADYRKVPAISNEANVEVKLLDKEGKNILRNISERANTRDFRTVVDLPIEGLSPGQYTVSCKIKSASEQSLAERNEPFTLPAKPEWWKNTFGVPEVKDIVPEPWVPVEKTKDGFTVWNRKVSLSSDLQPSMIINGNISMLASTASFQTKAFNIGPFRLEQEKKTGLIYSAPIFGEKISGQLILKVEFDGFMHYRLKLTPIEKTTVEKLILEIPLKSDLVTHYHHGGLGTPASFAELKVQKGYGKVSENGLEIPFTSTIWLGNDTLGLAWYAETDQYWSPAEEKKAVQVVRIGEKTLLRINFVNQPIEIDQPIQYEWALLPTPTKPMNKQFLHQLRYAQSGFDLNKELTGLSEDFPKFIEALVESGANAFGQWAWTGATSVWNEDFGAPGYRPKPLNEIRKKAFREAVRYAHEKGIRWVTVYAIWNCFSNWHDVGEIWREQALYPLVPSFGGYLYCPQAPFADWYIATLKRTIEELDIDGVYLDSSSSPRICSNLHHGHGYIDKTGKLHGTYPVFACRELHKRIYTLFHGEIKKDGLIYAHNSHFPFMAVESFVDVHHCGEGSTLDRDIAIPKFYGYPFGVPVSFTRWNNPVYPETRMNSWRFVLQMDSTIKAHPGMVISKKIFPDYKGFGREYYLAKGYDPQGEAVWQVWNAYRNFPWENSIWIPSWKSESYVTTGDKDILTCLHLNQKKAALLTCSSFKKDDTTVKLKVDWEKMGFDPRKVKILDCITLKEITDGIDNEGFILKINGNLFRMLLIIPSS
ncbi:MAG: DUF6067 family protein [Candidatus Omnitrophica bacterium]|nr:DUF6067 family protein [Candidatus Omnitrophota bacterium]